MLGVGLFFFYSCCENDDDEDDEGEGEGERRNMKTLQEMQKWRLGPIVY